MSRPSTEVIDHFDHPRNAGRIPNANAIGRSSLDGRAPYTNVYLLVREGRIEKAGFETFGCGFSIACCSLLTELATGRTIDECKALAAHEIIRGLGRVPENRQFCAELATKALHDAIGNWHSENGKEDV